MHDPWTDMLSAYIDGELSETQTLELEQHLASCETCARTHVELLAVLDAAQTLEDAPPQNDLWAGIAARIAAPAPAAVVPIEAARSSRVRRVTLSVPQLAAAAVVLMALSGGVVFTMTHNAGPQLASGTIVHSSGGDAGSAQLVDAPATPALDPAYDPDLAELERTLRQQRDQLDPETVEVIERSLESIDLAIAAARTALAADPGNPSLSRQLDNTMRKKLDVLRRVTRVQRAGS